MKELTQAQRRAVWQVIENMADDGLVSAVDQMAENYKQAGNMAGYTRLNDLVNRLTDIGNEIVDFYQEIGGYNGR